MAFVVGVGMSNFQKPGTRRYVDSAKDAVKDAMRDSGLSYADVDAVVAGSVYTDSTSGQRALREAGFATGVPVFNVNNNCSTGSSALMLARLLVLSGRFQCVLALGFEEMDSGLTLKYPKKVFPPDLHFDNLNQRPDVHAESEKVKGTDRFTSDVIRIFAHATREYMAKCPQATVADLATISVKNRRMGAVNPKACLHGLQPPPVKMVSVDRMLCPPITLHMSALTADGAACALIANRNFATSRFSSAGPLPEGRRRLVEIVAQHMCTDSMETFQKGVIEMTGFDLARRAAAACYRDANLTASDVDVLEVHDCFATNELLMYEALGLAKEFHGWELIRGGKWESNSTGGQVFKLNNRWVVNPSGGIESKGHPIGATGLAQCYELVKQLRGDSGVRQVDGARVGLQHNYGIGSAAVVTLYRTVPPVADGGTQGARSRL